MIVEYRRGVEEISFHLEANTENIGTGLLELMGTSV